MRRKYTPTDPISSIRYGGRQPKGEPAVVPVDDDTLYDVEALLRYRRADNRFLVRWLWYTSADDSWEPATALPIELIVNYFAILGEP
jgi:hypothetical protein